MKGGRGGGRRKGGTGWLEEEEDRLADRLADRQPSRHWETTFIYAQRDSQPINTGAFDWWWWCDCYCCMYAYLCHPDPSLLLPIRTISWRLFPFSCPKSESENDRKKDMSLNKNVKTNNLNENGKKINRKTNKAVK